MNRIPSLDGLRAISIYLVIIGHLYESIRHTAPSSPIWAILGNGGLGVTIFFVISGYLITSLLVREYDKFGTISLRDFYIRRAFRILPPFYLYLLAVAVCGALGFLSLTRGDVLSALSFTWDYSPYGKSWALQQIWSLSVEEQFYILWPTTLVLLLARFHRTSAATLAAVLILVTPALRISSHLSGNDFLMNRIYFMLHTRMDSLMFGCLAALLDGHAVLEHAYKRLRPIGVVFPIFVFIVSPQIEHRFGGAYIYTVGYTLIGFSITMMMLYSVRESDTPVGRLLNSRFITHVGVISYSTYLWQGLFLHEKNASILGRFPLNLLCIAAAAELSYRFVEQPFHEMAASIFKPA